MLNDARQKIVLTKRKRNNQMLMLVATAHFLSWLPLNTVNLIGKKYAFKKIEPVHAKYQLFFGMFHVGPVLPTINSTYCSACLASNSK